IEPRMFSFNGPHGACPACDGIGARTRIDPERVIQDGKRTLREGVVLAWGRRGSMSLASETERAVSTLGVDPDVAWSKLPEAQRQAILFGSAGPTGRGKKKSVPYEGIIPRLERLMREGGGLAPDVDETDDLDDDGSVPAEELGRFVITRTCDVCKGRRLRSE